MAGRNYKSNRIWILAVVVAIFIAAVIIIVSLSDSGKKSAQARAGVEYIKTVEAMDTAAIENSIYAASRQRLIDEMEGQLEEDPDQVWRILKELNTVMMGDSRVVGFDVFGYMDESHVLASAGATIGTIPESYDILQVLNPGLVVIAYGINDINSYWLWETIDEYIDDLNVKMTELTQLLPNAYIYVQSIIPAAQAGLEESPSWAEIPQWNAEIKANCEEMGWRYLDLSPVVEAHSDLYDIDGVHMMSVFYPYWAEAILLQYLEDSTS